MFAGKRESNAKSMKNSSAPRSLTHFMAIRYKPPEFKTNSGGFFYRRKVAFRSPGGCGRILQNGVQVSICKLQLKENHGKLAVKCEQRQRRRRRKHITGLSCVLRGLATELQTFSKTEVCCFGMFPIYTLLMFVLICYGC